MVELNTSYLDHIRTDDPYAILGLTTRTNLAPKQPRRDRNEGVRLPPGLPEVSPEALALPEESNKPSRVQLIGVLFKVLDTESYLWALRTVTASREQTRV